MVTRAARPPRVPRSRRDDRYDAGQPAPPKRASAGWVESVQDDTVTVVVSGESLPGVIPLDDMPPVGSIVEVEARGDLLVIPLWYPPPPEPVTVDLPAHNITGLLDGSSAALIVGGPEALATRDPASYVRFSSTDDQWAIHVGYDNTTGDPIGGFGLWTLPEGATFVSSVFVAEGYRVSSLAAAPFPQDDYDNAPAHTFPVITSYPFLVTEMSGMVDHPSISTFPLDVVGEALGQATGFSPTGVDRKSVV